MKFIDKSLKQLRLFFVICNILCVLVFVASVLYNAKYGVELSDIVLERWAIILTLLGIVGFLKFVQPNLDDDSVVDDKLIIKKYKKYYYIRHVGALSIFIFNTVCLHITGSKNFIFLAFITIFALFLCGPIKRPIELETENKDF
ncbi:MAG: hypothetical protein RL662_2402 [Bacteroidota bacterium]|jgi:D-alanyl-lipoteichoic acid acyltransferase DltB (MBOAT superfamily)